MEYPRELSLDSEVEKKLVSYLNEEIRNHQAERSGWVDDLTSWQTDYWAKPIKKEKTFPFKGASNIVIPLTAVAVEAIHAREMTTLFALNEFASIKVPDQYANLEYGIQKAIDHTLLKEVDMYKFADQTLLENKKLGTTVGKSGYEKVLKKAVRQQGDTEVAFKVVVKQGATADPVPIANFLMPFTSTDPQLSPWCGEEHRQSPYRVKVLAESGFFKSFVYEDLLSFVTAGTDQSSEKYTRNLRDLQNQNPIDNFKEVTWYEIWLAFDVDGDGEDEEIVVHYHLESGKIWSCRYNHYSDLHRPYRIGTYFPVEHRWAGIGIGKQNEQFQREVTIQHRQRIDNATVANMRMYKVRRGIGYGPDEPIFPGKMWFLDEMDDVDSIQMGEIYPSSYNNEQQAVIYSQQRTGVNEATLGSPSAGTPDTATGIAAKVQEGAHKFDYTYKSSRRFLAQISMDVLCNNAQFGYRNTTFFDTLGEVGPLVKSFLTPPDVMLLRDQILLDFDLAGQNNNKILDRNSYAQVSAIFQQYITGMMQLAMQSGQQQLIPPIAMIGMNAGTEIMRQILESFDIRKLDSLTLQKFLATVNGTQQPPLTQPNQGSPTPIPPTGMDITPSIGR